MDRNEVIKRLQEHLKMKKCQNGYLCAKDKNYCLHYVMDFLMLNRTQAKEFLRENIPAIAGLV